MWEKDWSIFPLLQILGKVDFLSKRPYSFFTVWTEDAATGNTTHTMLLSTVLITVQAQKTLVILKLKLLPKANSHLRIK